MLKNLFSKGPLATAAEPGPDRSEPAESRA
jgi:hypothetical protein